MLCREHTDSRPLISSYSGVGGGVGWAQASYSHSSLLGWDNTLDSVPGRQLSLQMVESKEVKGT